MSSHPNFDDGGGVDWHTDLPAARDLARQRGKFLFIECGRLAWHSCRALVESIIPQEPVKTLLNESFVCVAMDCDHIDPDLRALALAHLAPLRVLPFILVLDAEGGWIGGRTGSTSLQALSELLRNAKNSRP